VVADLLLSRAVDLSMVAVVLVVINLHVAVIVINVVPAGQRAIRSTIHLQHY
jgi:hypothetical protein